MEPLYNGHTGAVICPLWKGCPLSKVKRHYETIYCSTNFNTFSAISELPSKPLNKDNPLHKSPMATKDTSLCSNNHFRKQRILLYLEACKERGCQCPLSEVRCIVMPFPLDSNDQFPFQAPPPQPQPHPHPGGSEGAGGGLESHSSEMLHQLQSNQLSVRQFCSSVMTFVTPLVVSYLNRDFPWVTAPTRGRGGGDEQRKALPPCRTVAVCVCVCLQLLECVVDLMECEAMPARLHQQQDGKILRVSQCMSTEISDLKSLSRFHHIGTVKPAYCDHLWARKKKWP